MNFMLRRTRPASVALSLGLILTLSGAGCGRGDTRVNSDPGPGKPSRADGGDRALRPDPNQATPQASGTDRSVGTDSTGRPSDASGGTTAAGAGSGTSGTVTEKPESSPKK